MRFSSLELSAGLLVYKGSRRLDLTGRGLSLHHEQGNASNLDWPGSAPASSWHNNTMMHNVRWGRTSKQEGRQSTHSTRATRHLRKARMCPCHIPRGARLSSSELPMDLVCIPGVLGVDTSVRYPQRAVALWVGTRPSQCRHWGVCGATAAPEIGVVGQVQST